MKGVYHSVLDWSEREKGFTWKDYLEKGDYRMLKMNIFMFTITLSLKKREVTASEYENEKRIKEIYDDVHSKQLDYFRSI